MEILSYFRKCFEFVKESLSHKQVLIDDLADELILRIFQDLPHKEVCRVAAVCKRFKRISEDDQLKKDQINRIIYSFNRFIPLFISASEEEIHRLIDNYIKNHLKPSRQTEVLDVTGAADQFSSIRRGQITQTCELISCKSPNPRSYHWVFERDERNPILREEEKVNPTTLIDLFLMIQWRATTSVDGYDDLSGLSAFRLHNIEIRKEDWLKLNPGQMKLLNRALEYLNNRKFQSSVQIQQEIQTKKRKREHFPNEEESRIYGCVVKLANPHDPQNFKRRTVCHLRTALPSLQGF